MTKRQWIIMYTVFMTLVYAVILLNHDMKSLQNDIKHLEKEVNGLNEQYFNLYNSHNYVLRQIEDIKQF